jgi:hypothetical protein
LPTPADAGCGCGIHRTGIRKPSQKETMLPVSFHRCVATIQWQLV